MRPTPAMSRRTATITGSAAVIILVAGLVATAVMGGEGEPAAVKTSAGSTTTAAPASDASPETAAGGAGDATSEGATASTAAAGAAVDAAGSGAPAATGGGSPAGPGATAEPEALGDPQDPGPASPPKPGTYTYLVTGDEGEQETSVRFEDKGQTGSERRQTMTMEGAEGGGTFDIAWRADGQYLTRMRFSFGADSADCDWEPDIRSLASPLSKGLTWAYTSSCTVTFRGTPYKLDRKGNFEVVDLVREKVGGEVLDLWKIKSVEETSFGAAGGSKEQSTSLFSPKHGLQVKSTRAVEGSGPRGSRSGTRTTEIKSLVPS